MRNSLFSDKSALSAIGEHAEVVGRDNKADELAGHMMGGLAKGYAHPFIFVYGRTGSGKSTTVRTVCENLKPRITYTIINLRDASTLYGASTLIVEELGGTVRASHGRVATAQRLIDEIASAIRKRSTGDLFVMVLDEFDVMLSDTRSNPSNFVYKLSRMADELKRERCPVTIVAIMNNFIASSDLDDRIKSRLGASPEIFFEPYSKSELMAILQARAAVAFRPETVRPEALDYIADKVSQEHGDARRAIDLLRLAGEAAGAKGDTEVTREHVWMPASAG